MIYISESTPHFSDLSIMSTITYKDYYIISRMYYQFLIYFN